MMTAIEKFGKRANELIALANQVLASEQSTSGMLSSTWVNTELFANFRTSALSFILNLYGENHPYFKDFNHTVSSSRETSSTIRGRGILQSIKSEIEGGWLISFKGLVSAEIFADFLEMAEYLLKEKYKDAAAVMIGSVLEEHLRQLCNKYGIPVEDLKTGKPIPKKADLLNSELVKSGAYNPLDQKNVQSWLGLRNQAAHGKYGEYNQQQVELMLHGVTEFMTRNSI